MYLPPGIHSSNAIPVHEKIVSLHHLENELFFHVVQIRWYEGSDNVSSLSNMMDLQELAKASSGEEGLQASWHCPEPAG